MERSRGRRWRLVLQALVVTVVVGVAAAVALVPSLAARAGAHEWAWAPIIRRFAGFPADQSTPAFHSGVVDIRAFQRMAAIVPAGSSYALELPTTTSFQFTDVLSAGRLYAPALLPVDDATVARWVVGYRTPVKLARGATSVRRVVLGPGIVLVEQRGS